MEKNYLIHYGVLGMKWGVRRYQNFDGSYTKAGLKRYNNSLEKYEKKKKEYKEVKKDASKSKYEKRYARSKMLEAKQQLKKDYNHLALDKKGDQGKVLYSEGKRITSNANMTYTIARTGVAISFGAEFLKSQGVLDTPTVRAAEYTAVGLTALSGLKSLLDEIPNSKLRAYYSHTSNY